MPYKFNQWTGSLDETGPAASKAGATSTLPIPFAGDSTALTLTRSFRQQQQQRLWTPADITTALWLDATDASTITTVSGAVSEWRDKSGNARHVSQANAAWRPAVVTNAINGLQVLQFDGSDDRLTSTAVGLPTGSNARTLYAIYAPLRTTAISNAIAGQGSGATTGAWYTMQFRNQYGATGDPYFAGYAADLTDGAAQSLSVKIASVSYNGTTASLKRNGLVIASAARSLNTQGNGFFVGIAPDGFEPANMRLIEVIVTTGAPSTTVEERIEGYAAHRLALTASLPAGHPFKTTPPLV